MRQSSIISKKKDIPNEKDTSIAIELLIIERIMKFTSVDTYIPSERLIGYCMCNR